MKRLLLVVLTILLCCRAFAQAPADAILGQWINESKTSKVEFFKADDSTFSARLVWVADEKKKSREGMLFIKGMVYDETAGEWRTDWMYSPDHNMTAKGFLSIKDGILYVKGRKLGISGTEKFTRE
jgi:Uncharacterized protein conserved in bacteria (DUF2147).